MWSNNNKVIVSKIYLVYLIIWANRLKGQLDPRWNLLLMNKQATSKMLVLKCAFQMFYTRPRKVRLIEVMTSPFCIQLQMLIAKPWKLSWWCLIHCNSVISKSNLIQGNLALNRRLECYYQYIWFQSQTKMPFVQLKRRFNYENVICQYCSSRLSLHQVCIHNQCCHSCM